MDANVDPCRCPLCGAANECAMARGEEAPCWCASVTIDRAVLARIPANAQRTACVCARCAGADAKGRDVERR